MTAPTRSRSTRTAERAGRSRRADSALERRREARLAARAAAAAPAEAPPRPRRTPKPAPKPAPRTQPESAPKRSTEHSGRSRSAAAQRAYARRAQRAGGRARPVEPDEDRAAGRASFVILIIVLLTVGVAATLWLSTQAVADSYRLEDARTTADQLAERADQLQREVAKAESASALAERAKAMGMVPGGDPARLVVQPDGRVVVVGEPSVAKKPKPPKPPAPSTSTPTPPAAGHDDAPAGQQDSRGQDADAPEAG